MTYPLTTPEAIEKAITDNDSLIWWCVHKWYVSDYHARAIIAKDDLYQACRLKLWEKLPLYNSDLSALSTYMVRICKNGMRDEIVHMSWSGSRGIDSSAGELIEGRSQMLFSDLVGQDSEGDEFMSQWYLADTEFDPADVIGNDDWLDGLDETEKKAVIMLSNGYSFEEVGTALGFEPMGSVGVARQVQALAADVLRDRYDHLEDAELLSVQIGQTKTRRPRTCWLPNHCWYGHELTPENTYTVPAKEGYVPGKSMSDGSRGGERRKCKTCLRENKKYTYVAKPKTPKLVVEKLVKVKPPKAERQPRPPRIKTSRAKKPLLVNDWKYCECGCGRLTKISPSSNANYGWVRGEPRRYVQGHSNAHRARLMAEAT